MKQTLFYSSLLFSLVSFGQHEVLATGGNTTGSTGSVSYSLGQIAYESTSNANGFVYQGVQQPFEIVAVLAIADVESKFEVILYPNPATKSIILSLDFSLSGSNLDYEITDMNGKILRNGRIQTNDTSIDVENFAQAIYFVNILNSKKRIKSFKLIKNNQ